MITTEREKEKLKKKLLSVNFFSACSNMLSLTSKSFFHQQFGKIDNTYMENIFIRRIKYYLKILFYKIKGLFYLNNEFLNTIFN